MGAYVIQTENGPVIIGGGGSGIDVAAEVGQTIVVEEVDANGKPTKWKAAEYQPRTHWSEETVGDLVPHTVFSPAYYETVGMSLYTLPPFDLTDGKTYTAVYDGVEYNLTAEAGAYNGIPFVGMGNKVLQTGTPTVEPFIITHLQSPIDAFVVICLTEEETHTIQIIGEKTVYHMVPNAYLGYECRIVNLGNGYELPINWDELREAVMLGQQVYAKMPSANVDGSYLRIIFNLEYAYINIADSDEYTDVLHFEATEHHGYDFKSVAVYRYTDGTTKAIFS
jgi:hypothetical protein